VQHPPVVYDEYISTLPLNVHVRHIAERLLEEFLSLGRPSVSGRHAAAVITDNATFTDPLCNRDREATPTGANPPDRPFERAPIRFVDYELRRIGKER
jgi:hypothetical protein